MPFYQRDPFRELNKTRSWVNPYLNQLGENRQDGELPILFGEDLRNLQGAWRTRLQNLHQQEAAPKKLILEVGCHFGKTLSEMAKANVHDGFLGIDITFKRVVKSARRLKLQDSKNAAALLLDGRLLNMVLAPEELDGLVVFYPDPWSKRSQAKHRLLDEKTLQSWQSLLKAGGFFWLKTDQQGYFQETDILLRKLGFKPESEQNALLGRDFTSSFEAYFQKLNLGCFGQLYRK